MNHILPFNHSLLSLKEFLQYFHINHVKNLEKSFILLAKKDVTEMEKDIYITQESLCEKFPLAFNYENPSMAKR